MSEKFSIEKYQFRFATKADLPALFELVNLVYRGETGMRSWTGEAHLLAGQRTDLEQLTEILERPKSYIILATKTSDPVTIVGCANVRATDDGGSFLSMLTVHVDEQKNGLGKALLSEAERFARDALQAKQMSMYVITLRTELIEWYIRRGYEVTGEKREWFWGEPRYGIPLRDDLELGVLRKTLGPK